MVEDRQNFEDEENYENFADCTHSLGDRGRADLVGC